MAFTFPSIGGGCQPSGDFRMDSCGSFKGHNSEVTGLITCLNYPDRLISTSRDKTALIWKLERAFDGFVEGIPFKRLTGHSHFLTDISLSCDSNYALTSSWDKTIRLWDLKTGQCHQKFLGHTADILTVNFSTDSRHIVSGGRDKVVRIWNTLGHNKYNLLDNPHTDWISTAKISQPIGAVDGAGETVVVTGGWDHKIKLWDLSTTKHKADLQGHKNAVYCVAISPDGSLCASSGKDPYINIWDMTDMKHTFTLYGLPADCEKICFSPTRYLLAATSMAKVYVYDLEVKALVAELPTFGISSTPSAAFPKTTSITWSSDGNVLFVGYSNGNIRAWKYVSTPGGNMSD